jgi:hypothetical protein
MTKKSMMEIQMNWIYVLILGVIFLLFFSSVYKQVTANADRSLDIDTKAFLDNIFNTFRTIAKVQASIILPDKGLEVSCSGYNIEDSTLGVVSLEQIPLFSPDRIDKDILSYNMYWKMPFNVETFSYLTGANVKYFILDDNNNSEKLYELLPSDINKEIVAGYNVENKNYQKIRFITFEGAPSQSVLDSITGIKDKDVSLISIELIDGIFPEKIGRALYFEKDKSLFTGIGEITFAGSASLLGAIYAENPELFNCIMEKALKKLNIVTVIGRDRLQNFSQSGYF